jgi:hypothetical protein
MKQSNFFITYVAAGLTYFGIAIIQAAPFFMKYIKKRFFAKTPRDFDSLNEPEEFQYLEIYGFLLTVFMLSMAYALVAPLIIVFAAVSFCLAYVVFKYQLMYVFESKLESGGAWWPLVFDILCFSLGFFQVFTIGSLLLIAAGDVLPGRGNPRIPAYLISPLPFVTILYWIYLTFVIRPKSELVDTIHSISERPQRQEILNDRIFNPAAVKELPKMWVNPDQEKAAAILYAPEYTGLLDYIQKQDPSKTAFVNEQEKFWGVQRKFLAQRVKKGLGFLNKRKNSREEQSSNDTVPDLPTQQSETIMVVTEPSVKDLENQIDEAFGLKQ